MDTIRVGTVRFLNTRPLIEGLGALPGVALEPAVPSRLCGMLEEGRVDIALVSVIDAARSRVPLAVLPAGMIGSDGATLTVRLFCSGPVAEVREVWADTDSHTSVALCRVLLERVHGVRAEFRRYSAREQMVLDGGGGAAGGAGRAVLLIGDKVVSDPPEAAAFPVEVDLGAEWKAWTGMPFVYAAWMCRAAEAGRGEIAVAAGVLDRQRRHNMTRLGAIASAHAAGAGWPVELATRYLGEYLRYDLGAREREAAQRFVDECAGLGIVEPTRIAWVEWRGAALAAAGAGSPERELRE